jgi:plastocyanin
MACTLLPALAPPCTAVELSVTVHQADSRVLAGVVVVAEPATPPAAMRVPAKGVVSQKDLRFLPDILVVRTGTAVDFPNGDPVRHQVYSFSSDRPGLVTLGCNIHDSMIGYIYVTDSPWFGRTDASGGYRFRDLPAGDYTVRIWHPLIKDDAAVLSRQLAIGATEPPAVEFRLKKAINASSHNNGTAKQWEDY